MSFAAALNAETGSHPVPSDPCEWDASVRESDLGWARFPYLSDLPGGLGQVGWLRRVLAPRGILSIVPQAHLETPCDALVAAVPRGDPDYAKLRHAVGYLCDTRCRHISDSQLAALPRGFDESAGVHRCGCLPQTPLLLATAMADEIDGSQREPANLRSRLDTERFSADRITAVEAMVSQALTDAGANCKTFQT